MVLARRDGSLRVWPSRAPSRNFDALTGVTARATIQARRPAASAHCASRAS